MVWACDFIFVYSSTVSKLNIPKPERKFLPQSNSTTVLFVSVANVQAHNKIMSKQARWGTADDAKLLQLFRTPHNGVDPTKLDIHSVKAVYTKYFGEKKYANFAPLYRGKARQFNVSRTLDGHRKRKFHS